MSAQGFKLVSAIALLASSSLYAGEQINTDYVAGSHYTATFHQHAGDWQYTPADGQDLTLSGGESCARPTDLPKGVWLLTSDVNGAPQLQAPSALALPQGHSGAVSLVNCDQPADGVTTVAAPQILLDLLSATASAVRIDD
ncbi:MAG: hypothetical protein KDI71_15000 [Xanthomonadales bacterium]|nr:hypothetical protein [Xanthomonadales bacterium]